MEVTLGINTGFAINRFPEPREWTRIVAEELGLDTVQFTADLLNPFLPEPLVRREAERVRDCCERYGIRIQSTFTSAFTRVNHLMHPDAEIQRVWVNWFKRFFEVSRFLGAEGSGSHFGILTVHENSDPAVRERRIDRAVASWRELSHTAAELGFDYMLFEPMSVSRELGETIPETQALLDRCTDFAVPMRLCLDVDHGDLQSPDPRDTDAHEWIRAFGTVSPCIHIKQSLKDKSGHHPFTAKWNERGAIIPEEILAAMREAGIERCTLLLEISHRERWPSEQSVVADLKASAEYWRPAVAAEQARARNVPCR
ncbi:MAG: TIM barrel protein [FCB group bacterium]|jgi:sugar phosphate isomerase/epimerase|nr:TIM barrel protein [FCB group bacterium]